MLAGRKRPSSGSFGPDGRRVSGGGGGGGLGSGGPPLVRRRSAPGMGLAGGARGTVGSSSYEGGGGDGGSSSGAAVRAAGLSSSCRPSTSCAPGITSGHSSNKLFNPNKSLVVRRAPIMSTLSVAPGLTKKFQRPMTKRRAYDRGAEAALKTSTLGMKRRMDGMAKLMARAGKGLSYRAPNMNRGDGEDDGSGSESEDEKAPKEPEKPFEPLMVWQSPADGGEPVGLAPRKMTEMRADEYGVEEMVTVLKPAPVEAYSTKSQYVPPVLAKWLRPHQREGVKFMYDCVMGTKDYEGSGCILADDMGLGKTLQSVTLIYTLLKTGITARGGPTAKRVIVVCPCSLVKNWDNEFVKWLGPGTVKTLALAEADRKTIEKNIDIFVKTNMFNVLIASYECLRTHVGRLTKYRDCCDLLVCDEAHRLKNRDNQTSKALFSLPVQRRVLLTGTPMQNDLQEFFAMVDFTNPGVLGTQEEFRKNILFPVLRGREPDATEKHKTKMTQVQNEMSTLVNDFILRRVNTLNAQHLPPKLVQVVCCNLTEIQRNMYAHLVSSKDMQHALDGKQVNCLSSIQMLMKLSNHPSLVAEEDSSSSVGGGGRRAAAKKISYCEEEKSSAAPGADGIAKFLPYAPSGGGRSMNAPVFPEWSGKMFVLYRLMKEMRKPGNGNDKIVIISNYTQTLDLIGRMCRENSWGFCRLDGSIGMKKRQKMVDEFNDPSSSLVAFLLSSKAGGCGINLIGGNRLVLFDPDWNPAVDKQAAARCWRDGQKKRCFTYRFLATGTVEEKIFQRQLSKEGLQSIVDDKEQVNALSTKDLRNLFKLRQGTPSDTHDKLRCERCAIIADNYELEEKKILPRKLRACRELLDLMTQNEDAEKFLAPAKPEEDGVSREEYDKKVRQPIDFGTIRSKLGASPESASAYKSVAAFSKDVNRVFSNVLKVWEPGQEIADAARRLQGFFVEQWTELVPRLMAMKADDDEAKNDENKDPAEGDGDGEEPNAFQHNERGDDYQEQIGMPEEEDMRSWSHHYSTDTVDDPVFRAAMRGTDAVSFVFGLEVTWSLIQQRQQEEDERKAMEELEAAQELMGDEEDEEDEEGSNDEEKKEDEPGDDMEVDKKPAAESSSGDDDGDDENESWQLEKVLSIEEIQSSKTECSIEDCRSGLAACSIWNELIKGSTEQVCRSCLEEDFGGWPEGSGPTGEHLRFIEEMSSEDNGAADSVVEDADSASEEEVDSSEVNEDADEEMGDADEEKSEEDDSDDEVKAEEPEPAPEPEAKVSKSSSSPSARKVAGPSTETPATSSDGGNAPKPQKQKSPNWACGACTYENKPRKRKCEMCGIPKP